jgi:hypothetical protein
MGLNTQRVWKVLRSPDCFSIWQFAGIREGEVEGVSGYTGNVLPIERKDRPRTAADKSDGSTPLGGSMVVPFCWRRKTGLPNLPTQ